MVAPLLALLEFVPDHFHQTCLASPNLLNFVPCLTTLRTEKRNERFFSKRLPRRHILNILKKSDCNLNRAGSCFHSRAIVPSDRTHVGLVPEEKSSGDRRRLGHISKQGNVLLRFLLVEAAQVTVRSQQEWRSKFFHLAMRRGRKIAKVAMARKLAVHLYWMWRQGCDYGQTPKLGSHAGKPGHPDGVQSSTDVMIGHPAPSK